MHVCMYVRIFSLRPICSVISMRVSHEARTAQAMRHFAHYVIASERTHHCEYVNNRRDCDETQTRLWWNTDEIVMEHRRDCDGTQTRLWFNTDEIVMKHRRDCDETQTRLWWNTDEIVMEHRRDCDGTQTRLWWNTDEIVKEHRRDCDSTRHLADLQAACRSRQSARNGPGVRNPAIALCLSACLSVQVHVMNTRRVCVCVSFGVHAYMEMHIHYHAGKKPSCAL